MTTDGALYAGVVTHRRFKPRAHALRYRIFMLLLDLEALPGLFKRLRWLREGGLGLMSFRAADHGDRSGADLASQVRGHLSQAGIEAAGPVRLLCMPRILGYAFNPLSLYFCHDSDEILTAVLYEVRNTFGETHSYLIATPEGDTDLVRQQAAKRFHVSPFMDMDLTYAFTIAPPGQRVGIDILVSDGEGPVLAAAFHAQRRDLTDGNLLHAWLSHPLLSFKVMAGIHWEALKIAGKGLRLRPRPPPPSTTVTLGSAVATSVKSNS